MYGFDFLFLEFQLFSQHVPHETKSSANGFDYENLDLLQRMVGTTDLEVDFSSDDSVRDPDFELSEMEISQDHSIEDPLEIGRPRKVKLVSCDPLSTVDNVLKYDSSKVIAKKRNKGESYVRKSGIVAARKCTPLNRCRQNCKEKINFENQKIIFKSYWSLGTFIQRVLFIGGLIEIEDKKSQTLKKNEIRPRNRQHHIKYFININSEKVRVCQKCFKQCFNETESFLKSVVKKKLEQPNIPFKDFRGSGGGSNRISEEMIDLIKSHIDSFPAYESHYSRRDTSCKYFHADLTLATIYKLFCEKHPTTLVSMSKFSNIFKGTHQLTYNLIIFFLHR